MFLRVIRVTEGVLTLEMSYCKPGGSTPTNSGEFTGKTRDSLRAITLTVTFITRGGYKLEPVKGRDA